MFVQKGIGEKVRVGYFQWVQKQYEWDVALQRHELDIDQKLKLVAEEKSLGNRLKLVYDFLFRRLD